ncbi:hypothetical protein BH18CHL1_BH18CHL1_05690 [soil metagenome]
MNEARQSAGPRSGRSERLVHGLHFTREPRRLAAMLLLGVTGGLILTFLVARGELVGSDARAYWAAARTWLDGGDFYDPPQPFLPYVSAPWTLGLFVPWALLPWGVAWFAWRTANVLLFIWTVGWAYKRRPLATAITVAALIVPLAATLDTGNVTLFLALGLWAARFTGPRVAGLLWALATTIKWFPALLLLLFPARARAWGLAALALSGVLILATWPQTVQHIDLALNFPRPVRLDLLLLAWGAVPWLWLDERLWHVQSLRELATDSGVRLRAGWRRLRTSDAAAADARRMAGVRLRDLLGLG